MTPTALRRFRSGSLVATASLVVAASVHLVKVRREAERSTMPLSSVTSAGPMANDIPKGAPDPSNARSAVALEYGVAFRLVERLAHAKLDVRSLSDREIRAVLATHWRRHVAPYSGLAGDQARTVQSVGLSRSGAPRKGKELEAKPKGESAGVREALGPKPAGVAHLDENEKRERNIKTFGLGEGSYDQRECILAPPPSTLRFPVRLPSGGKFRSAPALLGDGEAVFTVAFRTANGGERRELASTSISGPSHEYKDWVVDLAAMGLSDVEGELELTVRQKSGDALVGLWGAPTVVAPRQTLLPYNVLFVIVDALRSDAIAASHDTETDRRRSSAKYPPLDAWFPAMPEVAPELDRLAGSGVIWEQSWSAAMWTRPATLSILTGLRASHTGLDILALELLGDQRRLFYERRPPLLPMMLRQAGATTAAFVNNMYLSGSVGVGVDFGFEHLVDHRQRVLDTRSITNDALSFLEQRKGERFFLLLNYASPHAPYEPQADDLRAIRRAPNRPEDLGVQNYLAEVHKDDAAIGVVLRKLDELRLRQSTLVVVTADHGETMSAAHDIVAVDVAQGVPSGRFTHLSTMWEEAARVPLILSLPGRIPSGKRLSARAQTIDLVPTILELEGLKVPSELDGRSLLGEIEGRAVEDRPVVIEGRGARSIIEGDYHLVLRDPVARRLRHRNEEYERAAELYDLSEDPGERHDISARHPEVVARLRTRLEQILVKKPAAASVGLREQAKPERLHFRFATAGRSGQLDVVLRGGNTRLDVVPVGIDPRAVRRVANEVHVRTTTIGDRVVGFDVELDSGAKELHWTVNLDGKPWPVNHVYAGPLGTRATELVDGIQSDVERSALESATLPHVVAGEELGMFVTRDPDSGVIELEVSAEAQLEAQQAMQAWGYARKPLPKKPE